MTERRIFTRNPQPVDQEPEANQDAPVIQQNFQAHEENSAAAFAQEYSTEFRYHHNKGKWMTWKDGIWIDDEKGLAEHRIRRMNDVRRVAGDLNGTDYGKMGKHSFSSNALKTARVHPSFAVNHLDFDANPYLVACPSGYIDLRTGEMHGHDRNKMFSRCCSVDPLDDATNGQWDDFLEQTTANAEGLTEYLQKFMGYSLSGLMNEEIMSFMYGPGGNGKGVFLKSVVSVFGSYAIPAPIEVFMKQQFKGHTTEIARLAGARLITASEPDEGGQWNMRFIKEWTGNEVKITARFIQKDDFSFEPIGKLLFVGNHKPDIGTVDDATARRMRMLPFMNKPKMVDKQLKEKMQASYPAIMRWIIDGAVKYFEDKHLNPPSSVEGVTMSYLQDQDLVSHFLEQYTVKASDNYHILNRDMRLALQLYGEINGVKAPTINAVNKKLNDLGVPTSNIKNGKGERCVKRVHLTQDMLDLMMKRRNEEQGKRTKRRKSGNDD